MRLVLARYTWLKVAVLLAAVVGFVLLYESQMRDSRNAAWETMTNPDGSPVPGARLPFSATAYCKGTTTASGVNVRSGIAAADPDLLPVGSVIQIDAPGTHERCRHIVGNDRDRDPGARQFPRR